MGRLQDKVAIITGGASGIGAATARLFAAEGACVMLADVDEVQGSALAEGLCELGGEVSFCKTDVSDSGQVGSCIRHTVEKWGKLDAMFANAGIQIEKTITETSESDWNRVIAVNLGGAFHCCQQAVLQMMKNGGGSIIATGSVLSLVAEPQLAAYCASKGGILMLIKSIANDYGGHNIRANCICPGYIDTPIAERYYDIQSDPCEARRQAGALHALGRTGRCDEVAHYVLFLASDESSFVTGSSVVVDGGLTAKV